MLNRVVFGLLFLMCSVVAARAGDVVDMGPIAGTVSGHIWSKVINQTGQTQSRSEIWHLSLAATAAPEFVVKCPDPYKLEVLVQWDAVDGETFEYRLDRTAGGLTKKFTSGWDPKTTRNIRILVRPTDSVTDQIYQLSTSLKGVGAAPTGASAPSATAAAAGWTGTWLRYENGAVAERMDISPTSTGILAILRDPAGNETGRFQGTLQGNTVQATSGHRKIAMSRAGGKISYTSTNLDGSSPWSAEYSKK